MNVGQAWDTNNAQQDQYNDNAQQNQSTTHEEWGANEIGGFDLCEFDKTELEIYAIDDEPTEFCGTVDSGAAVTVMPTEWLKDAPLGPSHKSETGVTFRTASGETVQAKGNKMIKVEPEGGESRNLTCAVTKVRKVLLAVSQLFEKGHEVYSGPQGSYIRNIHGGKITPLHLQNGGVHVMKLKRQFQEGKSLDISQMTPQGDLRQGSP